MLSSLRKKFVIISIKDSENRNTLVISWQSGCEHAASNKKNSGRLGLLLKIGLVWL